MGDGRSREDVPSKSRNISEDYSANTTASLKDYSNERARTDSAIGIQRELQLAFINIAKELYPIIHGIMEIDTARWLKQCCQDNYFSAYTYRQAKIRTFFHCIILFLYIIILYCCTKQTFFNLSFISQPLARNLRLKM